MPTRFNLEIISHTRLFRKLFTCGEFTNDYLSFQHVGRYYFSHVTVCKTSSKCIRVMSYTSYCNAQKWSEYNSFRSISDLCIYLETLAEKLSK